MDVILWNRIMGFFIIVDRYDYIIMEESFFNYDYEGVMKFIISIIFVYFFFGIVIMMFSCLWKKFNDYCR